MILERNEQLLAPHSYYEGERCQHCKHPIRETHYNNGWSPKWVHFNPQASYRDDEWDYCKGTRAAP